MNTPDGPFHAHPCFPKLQPPVTETYCNTEEPPAHTQAGARGFSPDTAGDPSSLFLPIPTVVTRANVRAAFFTSDDASPSPLLDEWSL